MTARAAPPTDRAGAPPRIGISSCLLGENVRFDGGHKRDGFLVGTFGRFVDWVPVCPEVELGLGTPRPTIRLERAAADGPVRLVEPKSGRDLTAAMSRFARARVEALANEDLSGYVLKKDSPSCGMERVKVHGLPGPPPKTGRGLFAGALLDRLPHLPVEEEGRLQDPVLRESFVERVFAWRRLEELGRGRLSAGDLVRFHTAHKLQLLSHSPRAYAELGRMVAGAKRPVRALLPAYRERFMSALEVHATRGRHANVLQHMLGYFRDRLDPGARADLAAAVEDYRGGLVPLVVPVTLVAHYVRRLEVAYLAGQTYLEPHPRELMLRNHV